MEDHPPGAPANPLPSCPDTPNCARVSRLFATTPDSLFQSVEQALQRMGATQIDANPMTHRVDAVFTVFLFEDDVAIVILPQPSGSALHIRSASRTGSYDFGVNRRRIQHFFDILVAQ